jgi:hypothetical protein
MEAIPVSASTRSRGGRDETPRHRCAEAQDSTAPGDVLLQQKGEFWSKERAVLPRRWRTIPQISDTFPAFSQPAIRSLIRKSRPHYDHRGEWVEGNGLAHAICQPGGKNGKIMMDEIGFGLWLERWVVPTETINPSTLDDATPSRR